MFTANNGLAELSKDETDKINNIDDSGSKEEKVFSLWINSLNMPGVKADDLCGDVSDGVILCSIVHHMNPKIINWKKVEIPAKNDFVKNSNCG